jgi:hypothetical protein
MSNKKKHILLIVSMFMAIVAVLGMFYVNEPAYLHKYFQASGVFLFFLMMLYLGHVLKSPDWNFDQAYYHDLKSEIEGYAQEFPEENTFSQQFHDMELTIRLVETDPENECPFNRDIKTATRFIDLDEKWIRKNTSGHLRYFFIRWLVYWRMIKNSTALDDDTCSWSADRHAMHEYIKKGYDAKALKKFMYSKMAMIEKNHSLPEERIRGIDNALRMAKIDFHG